MQPLARLSRTLGLASLLVAGCDEPKPRTQPPPLPVGDQAPVPIAERLPDWSRDLMSKPLSSLYPQTAAICIGNAENVQNRFPAPAPGVEIAGWGWDPQAKAPIPRILLVDAAGVVVGAGEPGIARPDVPAARPEVTAPDTGWSALTERTQGPVDVFGVIGGGKALCRLGRVEVG